MKEDEFKAPDPGPGATHGGVVGPPVPLSTAAIRPIRSGEIWRWLIAPWLCAMLAQYAGALAAAGLPSGPEILVWNAVIAAAAAYWCAIRLCKPSLAGLVIFVVALEYFPSGASRPNPPGMLAVLCSAAAWAIASHRDEGWRRIYHRLLDLRSGQSGAALRPALAGGLSALWQNLKPEWRASLLLFLATRLCLTMAGLLSRALLQMGHQLHLSPYPFLDIWGVWDSDWYVQISRLDYTGLPHTDPGMIGQTDVAFFPLYPELARWVGWAIGSDYLAGLLISNACLIGASILLYRLVRMDHDEPAARRAMGYLYLAPMAFLFSAFYTESLFLFLVLASFCCARRERWLLCGVFGLLAAQTRSTGVLVILPALVEYLSACGWKWRRIRPDLLYLLLIPIGTCLFGLYCYCLTGDFLAFSHVEAAWGHHWASPLPVLWSGLTAGDLTGRFCGWFSLAFLLVVLCGARRARPSYSLWALAMILAPLATGFVVSMPRYLAPVFPVYAICASVNQNSRFHQAMTIVLGLFQGCLMVFWTKGFLITM